VRLTDLLDAQVLDPSGTAIGRVHDVRLVQDGPAIGSVGATFRIEGLVVGGSSFGARLGFTRTAMRGPWLVERFFERLHAGELLVSWTAVRSVTEGEIRVDVARSDLARPPALP
jgi:sporulation protein YlmC with PRC-barrel domain